MRGHAPEVVHHVRGVLEHPVVDALVDVAHLRAALLAGRRVGLVDVPDLALLRVEDLSVDLELARDVEQVRKVGALLRGRKRKVACRRKRSIS